MQIYLISQVDLLDIKCLHLVYVHWRLLSVRLHIDHEEQKEKRFWLDMTLNLEFCILRFV